ncbi:MAG: trimeric intracellular cation channel family protein [Chloroflexi bacterium]|nr:trimeric intracellular cation channel family protein [Chloroflexota bacterium]
MDLAELVLLADRIGIVAFAIAGVAVGVRRRMDLFGLLAIGMLAAIGGGAVRDVLLGDLPRALTRTDYLAFAAGAAVLAIVAAWLGWRWPDRLLALADAIGTGAFAVAGALLAREAGLDWPAAVVLAILSATGGAVLRDELANRIPIAFRTDLNATAAGVGGLVAFFVAGEDEAVAAAAGAGLTAVLSLAGYAGLIRLPRMGSGASASD